MHDTVDTSYLFARLHGYASRITTINETPAQVEKHLDFMGLFLKWLPTPLQQFYQSLFDRFYFENLRVLVVLRLYFGRNYFFSSPPLFHSVYIPSIPLTSFLQTKSAPDCFALLPPHRLNKSLFRLITRLDETRNTFLFEAELDRLLTLDTKTAASLLSSSLRQTALSLLEIEHNLINILLVLRNRAYYKLPSEILSQLFLPSDSLPPGNLLRFSENPEISISLLPTMFRRKLSISDNSPLKTIEASFQRVFDKILLTHFNDYDHQENALVSFPFLFTKWVKKLPAQTNNNILKDRDRVSTRIDAPT